MTAGARNLPPAQTDKNMRHRVAITGIGLVTALGATREESWHRLTAGECGIGPTTLFDDLPYRSRLAAEAPMEQIDAQLTPLERRRWSRSDRIGMHAATEAIGDAGLLDSGTDRSRIGVFLGAGT